MTIGFCAENLLCVREIEIFEALVDVGDPRFHEKAWLIFRYFVNAGAPKEISISTLDRKNIMLNLSQPCKGMFNVAKESALQMLENDFRDFRLSAEYEELLDFMRKKKKEMDRHAKRSFFVGDLRKKKILDTFQKP